MGTGSASSPVLKLRRKPSIPAEPIILAVSSGEQRVVSSSKVICYGKDPSDVLSWPWRKEIPKSQVPRKCCFSIHCGLGSWFASEQYNK